MSTESDGAFFSTPANTMLLRRVSEELKTLSKEAIEPDGLVYNLTRMIDLMVANTINFDEFASVNIEWIGAGFLDELRGFLNNPLEKRRESLPSIFTSTYRFLCELEFSQPGDPSFDVRKIMSFVHENIDSFQGMDRQQLIYANYLMPAQIAKKLISHPSIADFRKFSDTVEASRKIKDEWDKQLEERQNLLRQLSENLKKTTSDYNFVGLVHGFQQLRQRKNFERKFSLISCVIIAISILFLPIAQGAFVIQNLSDIDKHKSTLAYFLPTIIAVEVFLLYFFRVVLSQFRSVKAQLLQIDLRISLCQFIESYAEYVSELRKKDSSALGKFEALIFSGLIADESGLPSTFDGVDQIANLLKSLRGGSPG